MTIKCSKCHEVFKTEVDLDVGQHVICPFCNVKFSYLVDEEIEKSSSSDFDRVRYFDGRDTKTSKLKKIRMIVLGVLALVVIGIIGSCIDGKNPTTTAITQNVLPFSRISWQWHSGGEGYAIYIINTDAPANAQLMATYVMGRLKSVQLISSSNSQKGEAVRLLVETIYELESELRSMGKGN